MPGESTSTRRRTIGTVARLVTVTSMFAGAVLPDPKKTVPNSSELTSGAAIPAGRELVVDPHPSAKSVETATTTNSNDRRRCIEATPFPCYAAVMKKIILLLALSVFSLSAASQEKLTRLLRQPDIHGDTVAFVYAGDIWLASSAGGDARRLTSDEGMEYFAKFCPGGGGGAFPGDYSGSRQVFVISVDGGAPRQLTFYNDVGPLPPRGGIDNRVMDWTPDGKSVLFLPQ